MEERAQLSDLRSLYVFSRQDTPPVPFDEVATTSLDPVTPKIRRFDQYRTITVQCWPTQGHLPSEVISAAMPKLKEFQKQLPDGFIFRFAGEQKEQVSGFGDLTTVLVICVCAIYLALLAQFKHAFKPLIVFAAIPYGVVGAVLSLAIMGQPFGFMRKLFFFLAFDRFNRNFPITLAPSNPTLFYTTPDAALPAGGSDAGEADRAR